MRHNSPESSLTIKDIEELRLYLPELPMNPSVAELSNIARMFLTKSVTEEDESLNVKESKPIEEQLVVAVTGAALSSKLDKTLLHPAELEGERKKLLINRDEKDFESETDTEEFEKVCQSPLGLKGSSLAKFEETLGSGDSEVQVLRYHLSEAGKLANETAIYLKTELIEMKSQSLTDKETILVLVKDIQAHISHLTQRYSDEVNALHNKLQEVSESKAVEISSFKNVISQKEEIIRDLTEDLSKIKNELGDVTNSNRELQEKLAASHELCDNLKTELKKAMDEKAEALRRLTEDFTIKISNYEERLNEIKEEKNRLLTEEREKLTHDYNAEIEELKSLLIRAELDCEMEKEKTTMELHEKFSDELNQKLEEMKNQITEEAETKHQKALKDATEQLTLEYKTEIENLRSRFKLMSAASSEKSPSDPNLEKTERVNMIELCNHEAIVSELKELANQEKEKAVQEARDAEKRKFQIQLEEQLKLGKGRMEEEKQIWLNVAVNRALADKNTQIETLMSRLENLMSECERHRDTIRLLTEGEHIRSASCPGAGTVEKIEILEKEKLALVSQLGERSTAEDTEIRHVGDMSASVAAVAVTDVVCRDAATSPEPSVRSDSSSREKSVKSPPGKISITSCSKGDAVLVVWNVEHANYTIYQETPTLYFLHSDCMDGLGLKPGSDWSLKKLYCVAEVIEKEYCHAKKSENRYNVPKGTKFYRVKVKPLVHTRESKSCQQPYHHSRAEEIAAKLRPLEMDKSQTKISLKSSITGSQFSLPGNVSE